MQKTKMSKYKLFNVDAVTFLKNTDPESIDLVITDPAYESFEKNRKQGSLNRRSKRSWFPIFPNERFYELFVELYRVLKKNSHFYMFCDTPTMFFSVPIGEDVGFKFWKPIIWDKVHIGMGYHYRARYEFILFFEKGKRKLNDLGTPDILVADRIKNGYLTEKPVKISEILISQSSEEGNLICDPFMGSGSVGVASLKNNRNFIGNDIAKSAVELAEKKLSSDY